MIQDIYRRVGGQHVHGDAREKFHALWNQYNCLDYMRTLLTLVCAYQAGGYHARVQLIEGTKRRYLRIWNEEERAVVRYIHNETELYGLYPDQLGVLSSVVKKERAEHVILGIRTIFSEEAERQAPKLGISLRDGFDLMKVIETTAIPDNPNALCSACGSPLVLKIVPEAAEGIAWVCTGRKKKNCESTPQPIGDYEGSVDASG